MKSRPPTVSSTPPTWTPRRSAGGARKEATERVSLKAPGFETTGWTLNISRGGLRAILEDRLTPGVEYEIIVGEAAAPRRAALVWSQEQADGQIVGLKYLDVDGSLPPSDGSTPPREE
ncbi:MAG: PilZ domain-containing protein [Myxococcota bacterium]